MKIQNQVTVPYIGPHDKTERINPATLHCQLWWHNVTYRSYAYGFHDRNVTLSSFTFTQQNSRQCLLTQFFQQSYICQVWQQMQKNYVVHGG